jgi:hypothetical protein
VPKNQFATINVAKMNSPVYKLEIADPPVPLTGTGPKAADWKWRPAAVPPFFAPMAL